MKKLWGKVKCWLGFHIGIAIDRFFIQYKCDRCGHTWERW